MLPKLLLLFVPALAVYSLNQVDFSQPLPSLSPQDELLVRVTENSSSLHNAPEIHNQYYGLLITNKNKKKAHDLYTVKYHRLAEFLKVNRLIPNEQALIKTRPKNKFGTKSKQWQYCIKFLVRSPRNQSAAMKDKLKQLGAQPLKNIADIVYLEDKWVASRMFVSAKLRLQNELIRIGGSHQIEEVHELNIDGVSGFEDSEQIQSQLQNEIAEYDKPQDQEDNYTLARNPEEELDVRMQVVFKVSRKKQPQHWFNWQQSYFDYNCSAWSFQHK